MFANEYDVHRWVQLYVQGHPAGPDPEDTPNLATAAKILRSLMEWADSCSDGWAYWPKPQRAAARLVELLRSAEGRLFSGEDEDCSLKELNTALTPIKSFLTRQGADWREVIAQDQEVSA